jgi:pimeloyl-ACP methyl ester carboxylesterase
MNSPRFFPPALAACFLAALAAAAASLPAAPLAWRDHTYIAHDKEKTPVRGQVATLVVPEDPAQPAGAKIELALLRLPATAASGSADTPAAANSAASAAQRPIVYLHGGPGGSALEHLDSPDFRALFAALQTQSEVILLDQRGCGASRPSLVPGREAPRLAADTLATRESFLGYLLQVSTLVRDRLAASGHEARLYHTLTSVEDLEALRVALGAEQLDLFAHSYGTQLAQAFARAHPGSVGRMVLVGSRGMDTARKLPAEADAFLEQIAALARADTTVGAKFPDLVATLRRVLAKLDAAPVAVEMENEKKEKFTLRVGGYALRFIIAKFYLNDPDNFRYLPKLLDELETGRRPWSLVFNLVQLLRSPVSFTWFTTDAASGVSAPRAAQIAAEARTALLGDAMNFPFPDIDRAWRMPDLGAAFRAPVACAAPTLFVAGTLDGITPVAQTREIMRTFSAAQLLVIENGGHNSQLRPPEVHAAIAAFLAEKPLAQTTVAMPKPAFMPLIAK